MLRLFSYLKVPMNSSLPSQPDFRPPVCYGSLKLASRYLLSPLAGYTNLPFRRIVREIGGVGLATTDHGQCPWIAGRQC